MPGMGDMRVMRQRSVVAGLAVVTGLGLVGVAGTASAEATGVILGAASANAIPNSYIVVFKDGATAPTTMAARYGGKVEHVYRAALHGYAAAMSETEAKRVAADPRVRYVTQNKTMHALDTEQDPPSWGIDRVDQRHLPLDQSYSYSVDAANVNAYIVDTGIRLTHQEFEGRAKSGYDAVDNDNDASDCMGHGTHVAGTVGGRTFGLAKKVNLWAVRVLDCKGHGTTAQVVAGVDWVTAHAIKPAVANMSLGGDADIALDEATQRSIASGVQYSIAAGNSRSDACDDSPARVPEAITVGATYLDDSRASFSNLGPCLDIFAPGLNITSAWVASDTAELTASGTSMAAPHVAGAVALYLSAHPGANAQEVRDAIVDASTPDKVTDPGAGSPNRLLYVDSGVVPPPVPAGCGRKANDSDVQIPDAGQPVGTVIKYAQCAGNAPKDLKVEVHVKHSHRGDLQVDLVGPSGKAYRLKNSGSAEPGQNIDQTFTVDVSAETNDGSWFIQVQDRSEGDAGHLDSWSMTLPGKAE
jgi:subtilisin family serine protease